VRYGDSGPDLFEAALEKYAELATSSQFILVLGDLPTHGANNVVLKSGYEQIVFQGLAHPNGKAVEKPIFYIPGNNDSLAGNYQPFSSALGSPLDNAVGWSGSCIHCEGQIIDDSMMKKRGYYAAYPLADNKDLALIALNTVQFDANGLYPNSEDAIEQLEWLDNLLIGLKAKQLIIAMHEPPGLQYLGQSMWVEKYTKQFLDLIAKHQVQFGEINLITSHTHTDELRRFKLKNNNYLYAYSAPSIGTNHYNNPGLKSFLLNEQLQLVDYTTHYSQFEQWSRKQWGNANYSAINGSEVIFDCKTTSSLASCLNSVSNEAICQAYEKGNYLSLKSPGLNSHYCYNILYKS